jgi:DNA-binding transcriptional ArsR family regulator
MSDKKNVDGRYAYEGLDRVLHEKARLGIVTSLAARADGLLFTDLKGLCHLTDGNLSRHLTVLQEAGIVEIHKGFRGRRPQTLCRLTDSGASATSTTSGARVGARRCRRSGEGGARRRGACCPRASARRDGGAAA